MKRSAWVIVFLVAAVIFSSSAFAAYPDTLTVTAPFINLPRPQDDPRWAEAYALWAARENTENVMKATAIFEDLAKSYPKKWEAQVWAARAYYLSGMRDSTENKRFAWMKKAEAAADRALALDPGNGFARYWRSAAIVLSRDFTPAEFNDIQAMARKYDHLREIPVPADDPLWPVFLKHWDKRLDRVELEKGIAILETLEKKCPGRIEPRMWLSRAYYWLHYHETTDPGKAAQALKGAEWGRRAVELEPRNPTAQYWVAANLGQHATYSGMLTMARYSIEIATRLQVVGEEDMNYYYGGLSQYFALAIARGGALVAKAAGFVGFSEADILKLSLFAARFEPRYLRNSYALGEMYLYLQKPDEAKKWLKLTLDADPSALPNFHPDNVIAQRLTKELWEKNFGKLP